MDIIHKLEQYRLEHRVTQEALAKELGVAFATVNRWFNARCKPNKIQAYHLEKFLKQKKETKNKQN